MRKILAVIKREYLQIVRTKGFIIGTVLGPVAMAALIFIPMLIAMASGGEKKTVGVIDTTGEIFADLDQKLDYKMSDGSRRYTLSQVAPGSDIAAQRNGLSRKVLAKKLSAYIFIPADILTGGAAEYAALNVSDFDEVKRLNEALNAVVIEKRLKKEGLDPAKVAQYTRRVGLKTIKVTERGEQEDVGGTFVIAYVLVLILYMTLFFYGSIIMRGVIEEKSSRVVEVVLSSLRPFELMAGKILGIAAVGLTQYAIWALFGMAASRYGGMLAAGAVPGASGFKMATIPPYIFVYFVVFFILGYFLYSVLFATIGSMVNSEKEAQQLLFPISMLLVVPMLMMMLVLKSPSGSTSVVLSLIPFFAPILMLMRICVLLPPFSQIAASIGILILTIILLIWVAAKIYRVGILMYGKRPNIGEIVKWIRYK
ncbi:MAG: ABC transporter permease [Candidatus Aminicenantes bacterium]|jgi:ABC-2 type transport system permease protein|nr:ABC transporter permease [Candidatus Aminicenantes bacterium]